MGDDRFEKHLRQVVQNINYEFQEGRLSAINLVSTIIEKLPEPLLEKHAHLFFLPLVVQLANDDSKECRESVAASLSALLKRSPTVLLQSFYDYALRWSNNEGSLRATSLQIFGIFIESRVDFFSRGNAEALIERVKSLLEESQNDWEIPYFSLICVEKLWKCFPRKLAVIGSLWNSVVQNLVHSHPWIKLAASRLFNSLLIESGIESSIRVDIKSLFTQERGILFQVIRNICFQLNLEEDEQNADLSEFAIKSLASLLPLIHSEPHLCFTTDESFNESGNKSRDPVLWLMTRLCSIARPKGHKRREAVFKCFAAFIARHCHLVMPHLELMLEPLHRSTTEASNELEKSSRAASRQTNAYELSVSSELELARDVLQLLEENCGATSEFLRAYAAVKTRATEKKQQRKIAAKTEAVLDPQAAAKRTIQKHDREKRRKKRRVEEWRRGRGVTTKQINSS